MVSASSDYAVTTEQYTTGLDPTACRCRRIDISVQLHTEYLAVHLPSMVNFPLEIKTAPQNDKDFKKHLLKGKAQTTGHLAKKLEHAFNFCGAGVDVSTIGVSLTQLSIEVIELRLSGLGTENVDVSGRSTGAMPLGLDRDMEEQHYLKPAPASMISGFVLLAAAILYADGKGISYNDMSISPNLEHPFECFDLLGSGAFASAFKIGEDEFMKVPHSASQAASLENEARVLKFLSTNNIPDDSVPSLKNADGGLSELRSVI